MTQLPCPYLQSEVELSVERMAHIVRQHPELPDNCVDLISQALLDPDEVRTDPRFPHTRLFSRWFADLLRGKIMVVAVVTGAPASTLPGPSRHWIVTAYPARRVTQGVIEWSRP